MCVCVYYMDYLYVIFDKKHTFTNLYIQRQLT